MRSPHRRDSGSSDDDGQPQTKGLKNEGQFLHFDINTNAVRSEFVAGQRRRRKFTPARRKEVAAVRKVGACPGCRKKHITCVHALKAASSQKSANLRSSPQPIPDTSNPSSLASSVSTDDGILQLEHLIEYIPPIKRYLHDYDEDPPSAWISDASWTSDSNRDPAAESMRCLSPKLEQLSNIIFPQAQPSKDEQLQQYIPVNGSMEPLYVLPARQRLPHGENNTWDSTSSTLRETTQPRRSRRDGVSKPPRSARSTRQLTPAMARSQSGQSQLSQHTASSPGYAPLSPAWTTPSQRMGYGDQQQFYTPLYQPQPYQTPQPHWPQPARVLDYEGNGMMDNMGMEVPGTAYAPPWLGYPPDMPTNYAPPVLDQRSGFLHPSTTVHNMIQPPNYNTRIPLQQTQMFQNMAFRPLPSSGYATSQPPSLTIEVSTAQSVFESISNHSGSRYPVQLPQKYDTGEDIFASTGSIEDMLRGGFKLDTNNEQPGAGYDTTKPPQHRADEFEGFEFLNIEDTNIDDLM